MLTSDERKMYQNFQDHLADLVDTYLKLGADPDQLKSVLTEEATSNLSIRREEIELGVGQQ